MPDVPDLAYVKDDSIKMILPQPTVNGSTAREQSYYSFPRLGLHDLNICLIFCKFFLYFCWNACCIS